MEVEKYTIQHGTNTLPMMQGTRVLSACAKHGHAVLYVVSPDNATEKVDRRFVAVATGEALVAEGDGAAEELTEANSTFVGTVREPGSYTWHVFEVAGQLPSELAAHSEHAEEPVA